MEVLGWILAAIAGIFSTGLVIGVVLTSRRAIHITQTNTVAQHNANSGGSGKAGSGAGATLVPVVALGTVAAVVVMALSQSSQSTAQVSAVAGQSIAAQTQIVQSMPQPQAPIVVHDTTPAPSVSLSDVAVGFGIVVNVVVWSIAAVMFIKRRRATQRTQAQGISHPAWNMQNTKEKERVK